jgi:putative heme iron utilization protein
VDIPVSAPIHLLHRCAFGTLATHARQPAAGYPYPTVLPYALDARHRPVILVSRLAEHTRNLMADPRAGFIVFDAPDGDVLSGERLTLTGKFVAVDGDATPEAVAARSALAQRYLRYHPGAARYMALGDFAFYTLVPERLRYIGGFGAMGWLEANTLDAFPAIDESSEQSILAEFTANQSLPHHVELLGVDRYGIDWVRNGVRGRVAFHEPIADAAILRSAVIESIATMG